MKGKRFGVWLAVLCLGVVLAGPAQGEMYVEGYMGGFFGANASDNLSGIWRDPTAGGPQSFHQSGRINPAFQGGLKLGTWFVPEGFLGFNYPGWMKYLGFFLDFNYHRLDFSQQKAINVVPGVAYFHDDFSTSGSAATLAFMVAARYGFFPDREVPFGRLQPYLALGPAILFSSQQPTFTSGVPWAYKPEVQSSVSAALAVESGLRYMALKNVSLEVSFKYRYACPTYHYEGPDSNGMLMDLYFKPNLNLFSFQVGAAYHF